jgi:hypothetical protein
MLTTVQDAVKHLLPSKRKTNATSGWVSFDAPCCETRGLTQHRKQRGGLLPNSDGSVSYHCFNCGFKASYQPGRQLSHKFRRLLGWFGADDGLIQKLVIDALRVRDLIKPEDIKDEPKEEVSFKVRSLPEGAKTFEQWTTWYTLNADNPEIPNVPYDFGMAVEYVHDRSIDMEKYEFYWTPEMDHNYHKRVTIPFYWKGQLIGSSARAVVDGLKPKYYSDYEPNYVFNVDKQTPEKQFVIVVEGPFDAMAIDGVAVLSNECSRVQADIIDDLDRDVIVVPDADKSGAKLVDQAIMYGWSVSFPIWMETHKDVASAVQAYGKLFVLKSILESVQHTRLKIELHKKRIYN